MHNVWIIARREFQHYFVSPLAYAVGIFLYLVLGIVFAGNILNGMLTGQISPDARDVLGTMVYLLLFTTPFLTMRLIADEAGSGTLELLMTAPLRDWQLVLGKWLGAMAFLVLLLALSWLYPIVLHRMTSPGIDQGLLVSAYLGVLLMTGAIVAIGVMVSSMFRNSLAAGFTTLAVIVGLWVIGLLATGLGGSNEVVRYLSFVGHLDSAFQGVIDLADVVYYLSMTVFGLFVASHLVESRRWR